MVLAWGNLQEVFVMLTVIVVVLLTGGFYVSGLLFHSTSASQVREDLHQL